MKTVVLITAGILLVALSAAFSQSDTLSKERWKELVVANDEYIQALIVLDKNVLENAKVLIHAFKTKRSASIEMARYHTSEIGRSLAASQDYLTRLQKATDIVMDEIQIAHLAGLHKHYQKAIGDHKVLQDELIKATPATAVIVMKAQEIYSEMEKAEKVQIDLHLKMEKKVPVPATSKK